MDLRGLECLGRSIDDTPSFSIEESKLNDESCCIFESQKNIKKGDLHFLK